MWGVWNTGCPGYEMFQMRVVWVVKSFGIFDVYDLGCSGRGMLAMWDVWNVYLGYGLSRMWEI